MKKRGVKVRTSGSDTSFKKRRLKRGERKKLRREITMKRRGFTPFNPDMKREVKIAWLRLQVLILYSLLGLFSFTSKINVFRKIKFGKNRLIKIEVVFLIVTILFSLFGFVLISYDGNMGNVITGFASFSLNIEENFGIDPVEENMNESFQPPVTDEGSEPMVPTPPDEVVPDDSGQIGVLPIYESEPMVPTPLVPVNESSDEFVLPVEEEPIVEEELLVPEVVGNETDFGILPIEENITEEPLVPEVDISIEGFEKIKYCVEEKSRFRGDLLRKGTCVEQNEIDLLYPCLLQPDLTIVCELNEELVEEIEAAGYDVSGFDVDAGDKGGFVISEQEEISGLKIVKIIERERSRELDRFWVSGTGQKGLANWTDSRGVEVAEMAVVGAESGVSVSGPLGAGRLRFIKGKQTVLGIDTAMRGQIEIGAHTNNFEVSDFFYGQCFNCSIDTNVTLSNVHAKEYLAHFPVNNTAMVGYWKLEGDATDASDEGNDGTVDGSAVEGKVDQAYDFNGIGDNITVADDASLNFNNSFTISSWIKTNDTSLGGFDPIVSKVGTSNDYFFFSFSSNKAYILMYDVGTATSSFATGTSTVIDNTWHHVVVRRNDTAFTFFVDGVYDGSNTDANANNNINLAGKPLYLGTDRAIANRRYNGTMDEVMIFNTSLSATEIAEIYNYGRSEVLRMEMTDNADDTSIGNSANDGTVSGATHVHEHYEFDGVNDYIDVSYNEDLNFTYKNFSISFWLKADKAMTNNGVVSKMTNGATEEWNILVYTDSILQLQWVNNTGDIVAAESGVVVLPDIWYHVVGTYNGTSINIYVDGDLKDTTATYGFLGETTNDVWVGGYWSTSYLFNGTIDEVLIYNRSLTATEISDLYNDGLYHTQQTEGADTAFYDSGVVDLAEWDRIREVYFTCSNDTYSNCSLSYKTGNITFAGVNTTDDGLVSYWNLSRAHVKYDEDNLVGYWKLEGNAEDDSYVGDNDGTISGCNLGVDGFVKKGIEFDGVDDYIVNTSTNTIATMNFSQGCVATWTYIKGWSTNYQTIFAKHNGATQWQKLDIYLARNGAGQTLTGSIADGTNSLGGSTKNPETGTLSTDTWYHIAFCWNSTNATIYQDGVLQETTDASGVSEPRVTSKHWWIGHAKASTYMWNGTIDEVMLFNRSLSSTEITELYQLQAGLMDTAVGDLHGKIHNQTMAAGYYENDAGLKFDGIDDSIINSSDVSDAMNLTGNFSLSMWLKRADTGRAQFFFSKQDTTSKSGIGAYFQADDTIKVEIGIGGGYYRPLTTETYTSTSDWYHFVWTHEDSDNAQNIYVDGVAQTVTSTVANITANTSAGMGYVIGANQARSAGTQFNGSIDSVAIWNRTLSADEVLQLYNSQSGWSTKSYGSPVRVNVDNRTLQYRVYLESENFTSTPTLTNVSIFYDNNAPTQDYPYIGAHLPYNSVLDLDDNIVGYWSFDETNGTFWSMDVAGINNGTVDGATSTQEGRVGRAYSFDGKDDYINAPFDFKRDNVGNFSHCLWAYPKGGAGTRRFITDGIAQGTLGLELGTGDTFICRETRTGGDSYYAATSTTTGDVDNWYHVCCVYNETDIEVYVNGNYEAKSSAFGVSTSLNLTNINIGADKNPSRWFNGTIDELIVWNRSLTVSEIADLYNSTYGRYKVRTTYDIAASVNNTEDLDGEDSMTYIYNWWKNDTSNAEMQPMMALYMPFETDDNTTRAKDYSGSGNTGTVSGATYDQDGGYDGFGAYEFDGDTDYIRVAADESFNFTSKNFSISVWAKSPNAPDGTTIQSFCGRSEATEGWIFSWTHSSSANPTFWIYDTAWSPSVVSSTINADTWYHFVGVFNGTSTSIYLNGVLEDADTNGPLIDSESTLSIGVHNDINVGDFNGTIDDVRIYNRSLSAEQILALYQNKTNTIVEQETDKYETWKAEITTCDQYECTASYNTSDVYISQADPVAGAINWVTTGGFTDNTLSYNQYMNEINISVTDADGDAEVSSVKILVYDPDRTAVINNLSMSSDSMHPVWNYSTNFQFTKSGIWTINITADDGYTTTTNSSWFNVSTNALSLADGWYGFTNNNLSSTSEINDLSNYGYDIFEFNQNVTGLTGNWTNLKNAINDSYVQNIKSGINLLLDINYSIPADVTAAQGNITDTLNNTLLDPYSVSIEYISLELYNEDLYNDSDKCKALNDISESTVDAMDNKFVVYSKTYSNTTCLDSGYIQYTQLLYIEPSSSAEWIAKEAKLMRTNSSINRIYVKLNSTLSTQVQTFQENIIDQLRGAINITTKIGNENVSEIIVNGTADIIVFNNKSTNELMMINVSNLTRANGKDVWDSTHDLLIGLNSNLNFTVNVSGYEATMVFFEDLDHIQMGGNTSSLLYKGAASDKKEFNYTDGTRDNSWGVSGNNDVKIELFDPHYELNQFLVYYGWLNTSYINTTYFTDYSVIILADQNQPELSKLNYTASEIYAYIGVADYNSTDQDNWYKNKTKETDDWLALNASLHIFVDGLDTGIGGTNFSSRMKDLVDYVQVDKDRKVILNTYTAYEDFATWGEGGVMKESCVNRWNGADSTVTNYSRESWSLELNKSKWYKKHNVNVYCQAFNNITQNNLYYPYNYTDLENVYFASKVLGYENFFLSDPTFNYAPTEYVYDVGTDLAKEYSTADNETYYRRYSAGIVYYNSSSGVGWIEDGRVINNASICFELYDDTDTNAWEFVVNELDETKAYGDYYINDSVTTNFTWEWHCVDLNATDYNNAHGRYLIEAWSTPRGSGSGFALGYSDVAVESKHSWYDSSEPDSWTVYDMGRNWHVKVFVNETKKTSVDAFSTITQNSSGTHHRRNVTLSSGNTYDMTVWSDPITVSGEDFKSFKIFNGSDFVTLDYTNSSACGTDDPTWSSISSGGHTYQGCIYDDGTDVVYRFSGPITSNLIGQLGSNNPPTQDIPYSGAHYPYNKSSIVGYWQFEDSANDETGINNGTVTEAVHTHEGRVGKAYEFDGVNDYIDIGDISQNATSLSVWFKPAQTITSTFTVDGLIGIGAGAGDDEIFLGQSTASLSNEIIAVFSTGVSGRDGWCDASGELTKDTWYHLIVAWNGSNNVIYLDGVNKWNCMGGTPMEIIADNLDIGVCDANYYFNGTIDEVIIWNRSLTSSEIADLYNSTAGYYEVKTNFDLGASVNNSADADSDSLTYIYNWWKNDTSNAEMQPIMALYMPFESNDSVDNITKDYSGYGNDGIVTSAEFKPTGGVDGFGAYSFDGKDDFINVSDDSIFDFGNFTDFSVSAWVKVAEPNAAWTKIVAKNTGLGNPRFILQHAYSGIVNCMIGDVDGEVATSLSTSDINDTEWHHVACVFDRDGDQVLYFDGNQEDSDSLASIGNISNNKYLTIGATESGIGNFNGTIDEVRVYNRTLTPQQILALYQNKTNTIVKEETLKHETWKAQVWTCDGLECTASENTSNLLVENSIPGVALVDPTNNTNSITHLINFTYYVNDTDGDEVDNCSLWLENVNASTGLTLNGTYSSITTNTYMNFSKNLTHGYHNWLVSCRDNSNEQGNSSQWTYIIENDYPQITQIRPLNNTYVANGTISFEFNMSDQDAVTNCSLTLDNENYKDMTYNTTTPGLEQAPYSNILTATLQSGNNHNYSITCCDLYGKCNLTANYTFHISQPYQPSPSQGSSGSSSGGSSGDRSEQAVTVEGVNIIVPYMVPAPLKIIPNDPTLSVYEVIIEIAKEVENIKVSVSEPTTIPIKKPGLEVFKYLQIDSFNLPDSFVSEVYIKFKVPKSAVKNKKVEVYHYKEVWNKLPTKLIAEEELFNSYESISPGLSYFAITLRQEKLLEKTITAKAKEFIEEKIIEFKRLTKKEIIYYGILPLLVIGLLVGYGVYKLVKFMKKHKRIRNYSLTTIIIAVLFSVFIPLQKDILLFAVAPIGVIGILIYLVVRFVVKRIKRKPAKKKSSKNK